MITMETLGTMMRRSGRHLTPRVARDWWTKGLLPTPRRLSRGRGKGNVTMWADERVLAQAKIAHDLLARHRRTETAIVRLWLMGFDIEVGKLRRAWLALIKRDQAPVRWRGNERPEDAVGDIVTSVVGSMTKDRGHVRQSLETALSEGPNVFYGTGEAVEAQDLGLAFTTSIRHLHPEIESAREFTWSDDYAIAALELLRDWGSLPAQRKVMASATHHELTRARRLLQIILGSFGRERENLDDPDRWPSIIVFGRVAVPVLVRLLRQEYAHVVVSIVLQVSRQMRSRVSTETLARSGLKVRAAVAKWVG